jgi:hypothetical protein
VSEIYYSFDQIVWHTYTSPIHLTQEGVRTVYYYAIDTVGNKETPKETSVTLHTLRGMLEWAFLQSYAYTDPKMNSVRALLRQVIKDMYWQDKNTLVPQTRGSVKIRIALAQQQCARVPNTTALQQTLAYTLTHL